MSDSATRSGLTALAPTSALLSRTDDRRRSIKGFFDDAPCLITDMTPLGPDQESTRRKWSISRLSMEPSGTQGQWQYRLTARETLGLTGEIKQKLKLKHRQIPEDADTGGGMTVDTTGAQASSSRPDTALEKFSKAFAWPAGASAANEGSASVEHAPTYEGEEHAQILSELPLIRSVIETFPTDRAVERDGSEQMIFQTPSYNVTIPNFICWEKKMKKGLCPNDRTAGLWTIEAKPSRQCLARPAGAGSPSGLSAVAPAQSGMPVSVPLDPTSSSPVRTQASNARTIRVISCESLKPEWTMKLDIENSIYNERELMGNVLEITDLRLERGISTLGHENPNPPTDQQSIEDFDGASQAKLADPAFTAQLKQVHDLVSALPLQSGFAAVSWSDSGLLVDLESRAKDPQTPGQDIRVRISRF
ncbi:hypothetical protein IAU59_000794 [Kwoniella sp. CBS 9459]